MEARCNMSLSILSIMSPIFVTQLKTIPRISLDNLHSCSQQLMAKYANFTGKVCKAGNMLTMVVVKKFLLKEISDQQSLDWPAQPSLHWCKIYSHSHVRWVRSVVHSTPLSLNYKERMKTFSKSVGDNLVSDQWEILLVSLASHWTDTTVHQASRSVKLTLDLMSLDTMLTQDIFYCKVTSSTTMKKG